MADPVPFYQDLRWIFTTLLAMYGAGLSTWEKWSKHLDQKPKVTVMLYPSIGVIFAGPPQKFLAIHVMNVGRLDVIFHDNSRSFAVKGLETRLGIYTKPINASLPVTLKHGDSFTTHFPLADAREFLSRAAVDGKVEVKACAHDAIQREYCSNWITVDLNEA
jgi:hypothetical protein